MLPSERRERKAAMMAIAKSRWQGITIPDWTLEEEHVRCLTSPVARLMARLKRFGLAALLEQNRRHDAVLFPPLAQTAPGQPIPEDMEPEEPKPYKP